jgi:hypothetical protein
MTESDAMNESQRGKKLSEKEVMWGKRDGGENREATPE